MDFRLAACEALATKPLPGHALSRSTCYFTDRTIDARSPQHGHRALRCCRSARSIRPRSRRHPRRAPLVEGPSVRIGACDSPGCPSAPHASVRVASQLLPRKRPPSREAVSHPGPPASLASTDGVALQHDMLWVDIAFSGADAVSNLRKPSSQCGDPLVDLLYGDTLETDA